jgi:uncharacterized membrane protein
MTFRRSLTAVLIAALGMGAASAPAGAAKAKSYKNCSAMNDVYPHGVGRKGASDKTSGTPVTNFKRSNKVYSYNDGGENRRPGEKDLDRDNDGIACEKR